VKDSRIIRISARQNRGGADRLCGIRRAYTIRTWLAQHAAQLQSKNPVVFECGGLPRFERRHIGDVSRQPALDNDDLGIPKVRRQHPIYNRGSLDAPRCS